MRLFRFAVAALAFSGLAVVQATHTTAPPTTAPTTKAPTTTAPTTKAPTTATPTTGAPTSCPTLAPQSGHCSHGYWKTHMGSTSDKHPVASAWPYAPGTCTQYVSTDYIKTIFPDSPAAGFYWANFATVLAAQSPNKLYSTTNLHDALALGGGGYSNIFRQAVATYFDSLVYTKAQSGFNTADVIAEFYREMLNGLDGGILDWWANFCHDTGSTCPDDAQVPSNLNGVNYQIIWGTCCPVGGIWSNTNLNCGTGKSPPGGFGDPQIGGFHGQSFQFHGLADEVFNLISTPTLQVNGHFAFLSSGKCDYTETQCWTHPGTYIDQLGFSFGDYRVKLVAGPHAKGLYMEIDGEALPQGNYKLSANGTDVTIKYNQAGQVQIKTHEFAFTIANSDMFFNLGTSLLNRHLLHLGAPRHTISDRQLCKKEEHVDETKFEAAIVEQQHNHGAVESVIESLYGGAQVPLHGLIGQTWRNVVVCGKHWVGAVSDYVVSDLFGDDYFFNFFHQE